MSTDRGGAELSTPSDAGTAADVPERFENPGLPAHIHRMGDLDPKAAKRAEWQIVLLLVVSILASIAGIVGYALIPVGTTLLDVRLHTLVLGLGLGLGMLGIGLAAAHWSKTLMSNKEYVEKRKPIASSPEVREEATGMLTTGVEEAGVARRPVLKGALVGAVALAPLPFVVPMIGGLPDSWNIDRWRRTAWGDVPDGTGGQLPNGDVGRRLAVDPVDRPIRAAEVTLGSAFQVIPHGLTALPAEEGYLEEKAKATVFMTRIDPAELTVSPERRDFIYDGIVAYSKVCTHVGCPVALYEQQTHHLLCPCHQSTFDLADEAKVVFGPARRALPQLPITVDTEGYLVARSDFLEPVGPSFWERERG